MVIILMIKSNHGKDIGKEKEVLRFFGVTVD